MENLIYKIFIFESNTGNLIRTEDYENLPEIQKEIIDYNKENLNNRLNIYFGTKFPPEGVKYNLQIKQFVSKTLKEKYEDDELEIPPDFKIIDNQMVRLTKKEMYDKGLLSLEYDEKIDELDNIVKLTKKEMYDLNKITKYQVYDYFIQELNIKVENKLKAFYNYPMQEMGTWDLKKNQSINWLKLNEEEKLNAIQTLDIAKFELLISESGILNSDSEEIRLDKLDILANKILTKFKELENTYGKMFSLKNEIKDELQIILNNENTDVYNKMQEKINLLDV